MFAAETIHGWKLFAEIRYLFYISHPEARVFDSIYLQVMHMLELGLTIHV